MPAREATYGYDNTGRLNSIVLANGYQISYNYDAMGNRTSVSVTKGTVSPGPVFNGFRFSLSPTDPAPANDILAATTGYLVPYKSDCISLLDSAGVPFSNSSNGGSLSISFSSFTAGNVYRIFASDPGQTGIISLSSMEWSSSSTPGSTLALTMAKPGGFLVLASNTALRYIADVYCVSNGAVDDAAKDRGVYNANNRILRVCKAVDTTASWSSGQTSAYRGRDNNKTLGVGRFGLMLGLTQDALPISIHARASCSSTSANLFYNTGFDVDGALAAVEGQEQFCDTKVRHQCSSFAWTPTVGWHFFQAVELFGGATTFTAYGGTDFAQLFAVVRM